jgi:hypothetical protein
VVEVELEVDEVFPQFVEGRPVSQLGVGWEAEVAETVF